ncbi:hypothetical protein ACFLYX_01910 [Chloroflexota bacterium]
MGQGTLLKADNKRFKAGVSYKLQRESATGYWGELTLLEPVPVTDGAGYIIETEDSRQRSCFLRRRINRAVSGFPYRHVYQFAGDRW